MRALILGAWFLASAVFAQPMPSVSAAELVQHQERIAQFLKWGVRPEEIGHQLRLWFGRMFVTECERATGECFIYLTRQQWDGSVLAPVIVERTLIATVASSQE